MPWWVKWRHTFADGPDDWQWYLVGNAKSKESIEKFVVEELRPEWLDEYSWSEHYRGIDFEVTEEVPDAVLIQKLTEAQEKVTHWKDVVRLYEGMLEKGK